MKLKELHYVIDYILLIILTITTIYSQFEEGNKNVGMFGNFKNDFKVDTTKIDSIDKIILDICNEDFEEVHKFEYAVNDTIKYIIQLDSFQMGMHLKIIKNNEEINTFKNMKMINSKSYFLYWVRKFQDKLFIIYYETKNSDNQVILMYDYSEEKIVDTTSIFSSYQILKDKLFYETLSRDKKYFYQYDKHKDLLMDSIHNPYGFIILKEYIDDLMLIKVNNQSTKNYIYDTDLNYIKKLNYNDSFYNSFYHKFDDIKVHYTMHPDNIKKFIKFTDNDKFEVLFPNVKNDQQMCNFTKKFEYLFYDSLFIHKLFIKNIETKKTKIFESKEKFYWAYDKNDTLFIQKSKNGEIKTKYLNCNFEVLKSEYSKEEPEKNYNDTIIQIHKPDGVSIAYRYIFKKDGDNKSKGLLFISYGGYQGKYLTNYYVEDRFHKLLVNNDIGIVICSVRGDSDISYKNYKDGINENIENPIKDIGSIIKDIYKKKLCPKRTIIGYAESYGVYLQAICGLKNPDYFDTQVFIAGDFDYKLAIENRLNRAEQLGMPSKEMYNFHEKVSPINNLTNNKKTPFYYIVVNEHDQRVSNKSAYNFMDKLDYYNIPYKFNLIEGANHSDMGGYSLYIDRFYSLNKFIFKRFKKFNKK